MFNERIRELRLARGLSQVELARILNVTKQSVSNWENDNIQPSIEMLAKIAKAFSVTTDYLLSLEDRRFIEVTDLTESELAHVQQIINDLTAGRSEK